MPLIFRWKIIFIVSYQTMKSAFAVGRLNFATNFYRLTNDQEDSDEEKQLFCCRLTKDSIRLEIL